MAALRDLYKASFKNRPRFDDGGYVSYAAPSPSAQYLTTDGSGGVTTQSGAAPTLSTGISPSALNTVSTPAIDASVNQTSTNAMNENAAANPSPSALSKILSSLGLGGGNTSNTAALTALTSILGAAGHYAQNKSNSQLPTMPAMGALAQLPTSSGSSTGYGPAGGYNYQSYQGANASTPGLGFAPRTQTPAQPAASYFTYGQGPEAQYFQQVKPNGGQLTPIPGSKRGGSVKMARGGAVPHFDVGGMVPNVGGMQSVLGQGATAQPGQTPMTPRPMSGIGQPPQQPMAATQGPPATPLMRGIVPPQQVQPGPVQRPPQLTNPGMGMPQSPGLQPRPATPPAQPSTMMQRMQMARPQMGRQMFADGGAVDPVTGQPVPQQTQSSPMRPLQQIAPSPLIQNQNPHTLGNAYRRGVGVAGQLPTGIHPVIQAHANGGPPDANEAANGMGANTGALSQANQSRHVTGPGDGTSDSIPARLASGEYVIDAQGVSMLGNGDNAAGARKLDEFRKNLRQHKGGALAKGQMAPDAKPIHKYMGGQ